MFTELLHAEVWLKRLERAGYRVILEPWDRPRTPQELRDEEQRQEEQRKIQRSRA